jgi:hypothetical protein
VFRQHKNLFACSVKVVKNFDLAIGRQFLTTRLNRDINTLENILLFKISHVKIVYNCVDKIQKEMFHLKWRYKWSFRFTQKVTGGMTPRFTVYT